MGRTILGSLFMLLLAACATTADSTARQTETASAVGAALADRHYRITVMQAYPRLGGSVNVSRDFCLEVKGDTLVSYLPFFGRSYRPSYGGVNEKGLNFTEKIRSYEQTTPRAGVTHIRMTVKNEEDSYLYILDVSASGRVTVRVQPMQRDNISFDGDMDL